MSGGGDEGLPEEHEEHVNHEAWVIPYADLLTLLMAMFIALFAMSTVDMSKFKDLALGFNEALGGGKLDAGIGGSGKATSAAIGEGNGAGPFQGGTLLPSDQVNVNSKDLAAILQGLSKAEDLKRAERQSLGEVKRSIDEAAKELGLGGQVQTKQLENGLQVTLLTDQVLFDSGQADVKSAALPLLTQIGQVLAQIDNNIEIRGHTDSDPLRANARFLDNLDLSSGRANAVYRVLSGLGIDTGRLKATGVGDEQPIASNATNAGKAKNRRVEIIVESKVKQRALEDAGVTDEPVKEEAPLTPGIDTPVTTGNATTPNLRPSLGPSGG